jgi:peptidyl-prolyl cis-trans isomerase B (cyclophilin B)
MNLLKKAGCALGMILLLFPAACGKPGRQYEIVEIQTKAGSIFIWLYDETPRHRENFLKLVNEGFYDGTQFHRIIRGFMIQGGDPLTKDGSERLKWGTGGVNYTLPAEIRRELYHKKGALAAARLSDEVNPQRESSGCQFYIVQGSVWTDGDLDRLEGEIRTATKDAAFTFSEQARQDYTSAGGAPQLDMQYTVFGQVIAGMDVVDQLAAMETGLLDQPVENLVMDVNVVKMSAGALKKKFGYTVPEKQK